MALPTTDNLSQFIPAGMLDRSIKVLGLTYVKIKGEATEVYAEIIATRAMKDDGGGNEDIKSGAVVALGTIQWMIRYNSQLGAESPNYEALKILEVVNTKGYLRDLAGNVMYDLNDNPLVSINSQVDIVYDILHIEEVGRRVGHRITSERWR